MRHRPHLPHILGIFHNGVVAREATHARNVQNGPFGPLLLVAVKRIDPVLACDVGLIIRKQQKMSLLVSASKTGRNRSGASGEK